MESKAAPSSSPSGTHPELAQETRKEPQLGGTQQEVGQSNTPALSHHSRSPLQRDSRGKKRDMGRAAWSQRKTDKRQRNDDEREAKRRRTERGDAPLPIYATKFSDDILAAEERKPKKKVAVLIGYAGTGYRGMQLAHDQKTIEGDLFKAFVDAGAISKANADDPKKSSFVRCARTDKGVHAAGNVISLKLIIENEDIVKKINDNLSSQIRVWGYERTNNSFSAYQLCDSRVYEYLIPSHSFLPPHPSSHLGRKCRELAEQRGDLEEFHSRQTEVEGFWEPVDREHIRPILESYEEDVRRILEKALYLKSDTEIEQSGGVVQDTPSFSGSDPMEEAVHEEDTSNQPKKFDYQPRRSVAIAEGVKRIRAAYMKTKRAYRIDESRLNRIRSILSLYVGTRNFHNYTVDKPWKDPSAKRVIKSFVVNQDPILIDGAEWLSLKVHGQSFMMHQIRKMIGMAALMVRCGCDPNRILESYGPESISIPKAPSLGLLLERPVFDSYNKRATNEYSKHPIDFDKYAKDIDDFKRREIYARMYEQEEKENTFGNFFNHVDSFPSDVFLFVTSGGIPAAKGVDQANGVEKSGVSALEAVDPDSDDDEAELPNDAAGHDG